MKHLVKLARKYVVPAVVLGVVSAQAQTATIPDATEMTTKIGLISGTAAAGAVLGFGIWIYRKLKAKAGQAMG